MLSILGWPHLLVTLMFCLGQLLRHVCIVRLVALRLSSKLILGKTTVVVHVNEQNLSLDQFSRVMVTEIIGVVKDETLKT